MSVIERALEVISGTQGDILLFFLSIGLHAIFLGRHRVTGKSKTKGNSLSSSKEAAQYTASIHDAKSAADALCCFREAVNKERVTADVYMAAVTAAVDKKDAALGRYALEHTPANLPKHVVAQVLFLAGPEGPLLSGGNPGSSLLQIYTQHLMGQDISGNQAAERLLTKAALHDGSIEVLRSVMIDGHDAQRVNQVFRHICSIRGLEEARNVLQGYPEPHPGLFKILMEASVKQKDLATTQEVFQEALEKNMVDSGTYNVLAKAFFQSGSSKKAYSVIKQMLSRDVSPTVGDFNEFIEVACIEYGESIWGWLEQMLKYGVKPNGLTCIHLLKYVAQHSKGDMERAWKMVDELHDVIPETFLSLLLDTLIQTNWTSLIPQTLEKYWEQRTVPAKTAYTYASVVRAYGNVGNITGVKKTWSEMKAQKVPITSVTLGCMVEACASNSDPDAGYQLITECMRDPMSKSVVNAVIYCSVLKGFSHQKRFDEVWRMYNEMRDARLQFSIVTYNTIIDACARSKDMSRIPKILDEMTEAGIQPNTISFSAIIKGYCNGLECRMDRAFELLEEMKSKSQIRPDEVTYNTLLDGCARYGMWDRGMRLLREMQDEGVTPSNFTLSVLVKLANRSKRASEAFQLVDGVAKQYRLCFNIHVFNNLMFACTLMNNLNRALDVLKQMMRERVRPDVRTYSLLLQVAVATKSTSDAAALLRASWGLPGAHEAVAGFEKFAKPVSGLPTEVVSHTLEGIANICKDTELASLLASELKGSQRRR